MIQNAKDFKLGAGLAGFCLLTLFYLIPSQVGPLTDTDALMPVLITVFILVLSLLLMLQALRRPMVEAAREHPPASQAPQRSSKVTLAAAVAIMAAYAWLLDVTGFVLTSLVSMVVLFLVFGVRRWLTIAVITVVTLAGLYVCFELLLGAPLPVGSLLEHFLD
jgi:hypothetical protein